MEGRVKGAKGGREGKGGRNGVEWAWHACACPHVCVWCLGGEAAGTCLIVSGLPLSHSWACLLPCVAQRTVGEASEARCICMLYLLYLYCYSCLYLYCCIYGICCAFIAASEQFVPHLYPPPPRIVTTPPLLVSTHPPLTNLPPSPLLVATPSPPLSNHPPRLLSLVAGPAVCSGGL